MCIVFYSLSHPGYKFVLAANRDEFLDRPASPAEWHNFDSDDKDKWVLCGRDLGSPDHGTWLGMTRDLRVGILTNIRYPLTPPPPDAPSRGRLLKAFLAPPAPDTHAVSDYLGAIDPDRYVGFNLLLFHLHKRADGWGETDAGYLSNRPTATRTVPTGDSCRGMSNSPLGDPYPKVTEGEAAMAATLQQSAERGEDDEALLERMMVLLSPGDPIKSVQDMPKATRVLPFQIGGNVESSDAPSGAARWYGTRISTVILIKDSGEVVFVERDIAVLDEQGQPVPGTLAAQRRECFLAQES